MTQANFKLYLDESGDHLLYPLEEYEQDPTLESHCTLVGVIVDRNKEALLKARFKELKRRLWDTETGVIFHSVSIRHKQGPFVIFKYVPETYEEFKSEMNTITQEIHPTIICASLHKKAWVRKYPQKLYFQDSPYEQAFVFLLERYAHFLNNQPFDVVSGEIIAEQRSPQKDRALGQVYLGAKEYGTQFYPKQSFFEKLPKKMEFKPKSFNIPGLQLSDYSCYPFYINHKQPSRPNEHYDFLQQFIYFGEFGKYGHKKWPI